MIKHTKIPGNINSLLSGAESYLKSRPDVYFAYLFGSLATKKPTPLSDVDIAIYLSEDSNTSNKRFEILGELSDILQTDEIDLVILNSAPLTLKMKILANRKIVADNAPFKRHSYESMTLRQYFDFSKIEKGILEKRFLNG